MNDKQRSYMIEYHEAQPCDKWKTSEIAKVKFEYDYNGNTVFGKTIYTHMNGEQHTTVNRFSWDKFVMDHFIRPKKDVQDVQEVQPVGKEKGILFRPELVIAILSGWKTQTRRLYTDKTYCQVSDILWVREKFKVEDGKAIFDMDRTDLKSKPGIHMRRDQSRVSLRVKRVDVQNIQDISNQDAIEEGTSGLEEFEKLWDNIHSAKGHGWETNPKVWVIEFELIN